MYISFVAQSNTEDNNTAIIYRIDISDILKYPYQTYISMLVSNSETSKHIPIDKDIDGSIILTEYTKYFHYIRQIYNGRITKFSDLMMYNVWSIYDEPIYNKDNIDEIMNMIDFYGFHTIKRKQIEIDQLSIFSYQDLIFEKLSKYKSILDFILYHNGTIVGEYLLSTIMNENPTSIDILVNINTIRSMIFWNNNMGATLSDSNLDEVSKFIYEKFGLINNTDICIKDSNFKHVMKTISFKHINDIGKSYDYLNVNIHLYTNIKLVIHHLPFDFHKLSYDGLSLSIYRPSSVKNLESKWIRKDIEIFLMDPIKRGFYIYNE